MAMTPPQKRIHVAYIFPVVIFGIFTVIDFTQHRDTYGAADLIIMGLSLLGVHVILRWKRKEKRQP
jgi:hypothetical protein